MKTILILTFTIYVGTLHAQCAGSLNEKKLNHEIVMEDGKQFLLGKINVEGLKTAPYGSWYFKSYDSYAVDEALVEHFAADLKPKRIKLFLGTWCGDSRREVPRFIKILEAANYPMENLEIVALDRRKGRVKTSPNGEEKGLHIIKVPTFIFFDNGREINRIVESPIETLEEDLHAIMGNREYTPNYARKSP